MEFQHLARTLHSTLISTFLDCAPSVFSPNGKVDETQAKLIVAVAEIARHLYGAILQSTSDTVCRSLLGNCCLIDMSKDSERRAGACADLKSILGYMAPYFPFKLNGSREIKVDEKVIPWRFPHPEFIYQAEQIFQSLNLIYCELTSLLILTSDTASIRRDKRTVQGQEGSKNSLQSQTERVSDYVVELLNGASLSTSQLGRPLTQSAYTALLPTIWSLINNANPNLRDVSSDVLQATIDHASRVSSKAASKQVTVEFIARIILVSRFVGR
jgi:pre-rRNA-processing protein IPI1